MVNLITYDLKQPGRDYSSLYEAIKSYDSWAHPAESVWFVDTSKTPGDIWDHLKQHIDSNDLIFIVRMHQHWASYNLPDTIIEWLKSSSRNW